MDRSEPRREKRKIPPLVWIIIAVLILWGVIALVQRAGTAETPEGGTMPMAEQDETLMPAAPPRPEAPATPPSIAEGPVTE